MLPATGGWGGECGPRAQYSPGALMSFLKRKKPCITGVLNLQFFPKVQFQNQDFSCLISTVVMFSFNPNLLTPIAPPNPARAGLSFAGVKVRVPVTAVTWTPRILAPEKCHSPPRSALTRSALEVCALEKAFPSAPANSQATEARSPTEKGPAVCRETPRASMSGTHRCSILWVQRQLPGLPGTTAMRVPLPRAMVSPLKGFKIHCHLII